jgi:hypothetical protein
MKVNEVGHIRQSSTSVIYSVESMKALKSVIIPHFDKYPLITPKRSDFLLFKSAARARCIAPRGRLYN